MIFLGDGNNGKTVLMDLMQKAFGKYIVVLPTSFLTGQETASSSATPELAGTSQVPGSIVFHEPNEYDILNVAKIKRYTGNDVVCARRLYSECFDFKPQFKAVVLANRVPKANTTDPALWRRVRILPFKSAFLQSIRRRWRIDINVRYSLRTSIFLIAFHGLRAHLCGYSLIHSERCAPERGLSSNRPKSWQQLTDARERTIFCIEYVNTQLAVVNGKESNVEKLFDHFGKWHKHSYPQYKMAMTSAEFRTELAKKLGPSDEFGNVKNVMVLRRRKSKASHANR